MECCWIQRTASPGTAAGDDENLSHALPLLPRLTILEIGVALPSDHFSIPAFQRLVESRWLPDSSVDGLTCLRREVIFSSGDQYSRTVFLTDSVIGALRPVKQKDMKVSTGIQYYIQINA